MLETLGELYYLARAKDVHLSGCFERFVELDRRGRVKHDVNRVDEHLLVLFRDAQSVHQDVAWNDLQLLSKVRIELGDGVEELAFAELVESVLRRLSSLDSDENVDLVQVVA